MQETILILDFGSQYTQLIARRIRELNVYCEIFPFHHFPVPGDHIKGVILSGSPFSVRDENAPIPDLSALRGKVPVLGICYGAQYLAQFSGGMVAPSSIREYGRANLTYLDPESLLLKGMSQGTQVWMSHADTILRIPENFRTIASTPDVAFAGYHVTNENTYGIQFHPEVYHSTEGLILLQNFVEVICGCSRSWTPQSFVETTINGLKSKLGNDKVVLGLSGGVDSSVTAMLLHKAIGKNLYCIFVDNGLLRKNEFRSVLDRYKRLDLNVTGVDAGDLFLDALENVVDPEKKRKIIGKTFIDVFDAEAHKIREIQWLAQGTIYPDIIESHSVKGPSATIKSHHNVGGLPDHLKLKIVEPLNTLFKDEVRKVGKALGLDDDFLNRHPFPGPGLAVRILSDIDRKKVRLLQEVDDVFISALRTHGLYHKVWQAFAVLLPVQSVGVMGDERSYENVIALRAVNSVDGMTADFFHFPKEFLTYVSNKIINSVRGVNRVVYDISSKPPATIEWE
ncbi:MAG: glutamine-hydrolyzing GMP synthase [Bacteroidota bacterium]